MAYSLNNAKQRLIDMFVNRVVLFDNECFIYFNISDNKGTQLKLSEQPDFEQKTEFLTKKEQPEHKCSDCYHLAIRRQHKTIKQIRLYIQSLQPVYHNRH